MGTAVRNNSRAEKGRARGPTRRAATGVLRHATRRGRLGGRVLREVDQRGVPLGVGGADGFRQTPDRRAASGVGRRLHVPGPGLPPEGRVESRGRMVRHQSQSGSQPPGPTTTRK